MSCRWLDMDELITTLKELEEQKWFSWEECWVDIHGRID
jgi:hypothetical protein